MGGFLVNRIEPIVILPILVHVLLYSLEMGLFFLSKSQLYSADCQFSNSVATHPWIQTNLEWPQCKSPVPDLICVTRTDDICECDIIRQKFISTVSNLIVNSLSLFCTKSYFFNTVQPINITFCKMREIIEQNFSMVQIFY